MSIHEQLGGLMGFAVRSGTVIFGTDSIVKCIRSEKAALVLIDADASENTSKRICDCCTNRQVPYYITQAGFIDQASGKQGRMAAAFLHSNITVEIQRRLSESEDKRSTLQAGV